MLLSCQICSLWLYLGTLGPRHPYSLLPPPCGLAGGVPGLSMRRASHVGVYGATLLG